MESDHDVINLDQHALQPYEVTMSYMYVGLSHLKRFFCTCHVIITTHKRIFHPTIMWFSSSYKPASPLKLNLRETSSENTRSGLKRKNHLSPNRTQESKPTMDTSFFYHSCMRGGGIPIIVCTVSEKNKLTNTSQLNLHTSMCTVDIPT